MVDDFKFLLNKLGDSDSSLTVTKINERYFTWLVFAEISLSKETISKTDSSALIDSSQAFNTSDLCSIKVSLTLSIGAITGHRYNKLIALNARLLIELHNLSQIESKNLLWHEHVLLSHRLNFKTNLLILKIDNLVGNKLFFLLKLCFTSLIESKESSWEHNRVLEISSDLIFDRFTNESFFVSKCSIDWSLSV